MASKLIKFGEPTIKKMKTLFYLFAFSIIFISISSCSKCYDCVTQQNILDSNGNVIDQSEVHEDVCTASNDEIAQKEQDGAVCSK